MYIKRQISQQIKKDLLNTNKIVIIYGSRQVGKTTLANRLLKDIKSNTLKINAEQTKYQSILSSQDVKKISLLIGDHQLLFIDEAQSIPNIGINLKLIHDHLPQVKVLVTGSSSFNLANKINEPLTGRSWKYSLFPISYSELLKTHSKFDLTNQLEERLVFGSYPQIVTIESYQAKQRYLQELTDAYLFKDIFNFANIKHHSKIRQLLKLIAFQIGSQVSIHELANNLNISRDSVNNYLNLLEKSFIIFRLSGFSRNLRKEVVKMDKIFFYDLGIRNTVIDNLNLLDLRQDVGQLWENFLIAERLKINSYNRHYCSSHFWRLHSGAEIDYLEEYGGGLHAYEFKWSNKKIKAPKSWQATYPNSSFKLISQNNYLDFITQVLKPAS